MNSSSPSSACKTAGLKGLNELSERSGQSTQTLINWFKKKPDLFRLLLVGAATERHHEMITGIVV